MRILTYHLLLLLAMLLPFSFLGVRAQQANNVMAKTCDFVTSSKVEGDFVLVEEGSDQVALFVAGGDENGIKRVADLLCEDIERVSGQKPELFISSDVPEAKRLVIIGSVEGSSAIKNLAESGKICIADIKGKWEASFITVVDHPFPGVEEALVIAGSDKRGTIYGMFELSQQMGISPWYWWADVPVEKKDRLFVKAGCYVIDSPKVKYRGIFLNDEEPALGNWAREKFGGFNAKFYDKVFELILRMKGNFLWPAMWGKAFYDDDPRNAELADEYGVVIGFSHHEPMMRSHVEWERYGKGPWDYTRNAATLRNFWREGIERMGDHENIVTVGMRGDGDMPMSDERNIELLSGIIEDQRGIISDVTGRPAEETPQVWALYKEVQDYYDMGMRVPEDITLLYCDDNWGNVRRVPGGEERQRAGGSGMYYHFDYVGGPRNYKWLNTNPLPRIWEQMKLSYEYGIDRLWVVNVGDLKPMELPIQFFLDLAWNPDAVGTKELDAYSYLWAAQQFGKERAAQIAVFLDKYTKFNGRRKPELLSPDTYSLLHYREAEKVVGEYNLLAAEAREFYETMPENMKDAYYQLVLFPIEACANLNHLYYAAAKNRLYAEQGGALTNAMADSVKLLFERDAKLTEYFHTELAGGKWNHMMSQTHIGYTYWQQPEENNIPETRTIKLPPKPEMGIMAEGSDKWWPETSELSELPVIDDVSKMRRYIEVFNRGAEAFRYSTDTSHPWLKISHPEGVLETRKRLWVSVDWGKVPAGIHKASVEINGAGQTLKVVVPVEKRDEETFKSIKGFVESNGYISIEADHYAKKHDTVDTKWMTIPDMGRTGSAVTIHPVTAESREPGDEVMLEYPVHLKSSGKVTVHAYFSPTLNYTAGDGFKYAIGFDDKVPVIVNIHEDETHSDWQRWVADNINICTSEHEIQSPGNHVLRFYMVDPGLVLQKIVIDTGGLKETYLGPDESRFLY
ncbi:MAG: hypothetical protein PWR04_59 [Anaerophaga sp.]|nr:hypothetical protein [Anaerophaga sp.]